MGFNPVIKGKRLNGNKFNFLKIRMLRIQEVIMFSMHHVF